jgi:hypothetical protein
MTFSMTKSASSGSGRTEGNHRFREETDPLGFGAVPLTLRKRGRIVRGARGGQQAFSEEFPSRGRRTPLGVAGSDASPASRRAPMRARHTPSVLQIATARRPDAFRAALAATGCALALIASLWATSPVRAQDTQIIYPGSMAVTGFPGTWIPGIEGGLPPGVDPVDETFIDPERASLRVFDVSNLGGAAAGQLVFTPQPFEVMASQIGNVFGITFNDGVRNGEATNIPDLFAASSSLHGIRIVTPDDDGDGRPERQRNGTAGATFMEGQFAEENGGSPGAIWKIDGISGAVSLFATIDANSGPGLGDVAFDKANRQFFATDLDTGLIHRISVDGALIDTFDHGVNGRSARGLAPVADDGATMDVQNPAFDTENPATWGMTQDERRVWAVQFHGDRAYYSVGDNAEIWSVGINRDGTFAGDARWELTVAADQDLPVTDIAFDSRGFMYLAQRGETLNRYDYEQIADSGEGVVLRYWRESPDNPATESIWVEVPHEYAVGFPAGHRQTAGGLDLQYGYRNDGTFDFDACSATLVKTGDRLRDNPAFADQLEPGGPFAVHGVQITDSSLVRPKNEPPFGSWFIDYDGFFEDLTVEGHVGDVEVWRPCEGRAGYYEEVPGGFLPPFYPPEFPPDGEIPPCLDVEDVEYWCTPAGLEADLYLRDVAGIGGDSIKAESKTVGTLISPFKQTQPAGAPYTIGITGHTPGDNVNVGLCFYQQSEADKGGYYPCCKVTVTLETPSVACAP